MSIEATSNKFLLKQYDDIKNNVTSQLNNVMQVLGLIEMYYTASDTYSLLSESLLLFLSLSSFLFLYKNEVGKILYPTQLCIIQFKNKYEAMNLTKTFHMTINNR